MSDRLGVEDRWGKYEATHDRRHVAVAITTGHRPALTVIIVDTSCVDIVPATIVIVSEAVLSAHIISREHTIPIVVPYVMQLRSPCVICFLV